MRKLRVASVVFASAFLAVLLKVQKSGSSSENSFSQGAGSDSDRALFVERHPHVLYSAANSPQHNTLKTMPAAMSDHSHSHSNSSLVRMTNNSATIEALMLQTNGCE